MSKEGFRQIKIPERKDDEVLAAIKRLKQAELNDELWCDECLDYHPRQQVKLVGNDWLCSACALKRAR